MPIGRALRSRITSDAQSSDYWYVPHAQTVGQENWDRIAEQLRILANFQTIPWNEAQPKYVKELAKRKLIDPYLSHKKGFSAVGRMQFPVWRLLGLAWVNNHSPEITDVGLRFVKAKDIQERRELLELQLHRYQFYNPSAASHFKNFRIFPVLGLYRLLSRTDWRLSWDEFLLFGTRIRNFPDADDLADLVGDWRALINTERNQLKAVAETVQAKSHTKSHEGTTWNKLLNDESYLRATLSILQTIIQSDNGLEVPAAQRRRVQRIVLESATSAEVIDYASEQDWLALYGQVPQSQYWTKPWTTATEAKAYYERIGRIDAATDAFAKETKRSPKAIEEYRSIQVLERVLEDVLEHNLQVLEPDLKLIPGGRQFATAVGPIDLLAKDGRGIYVVIELKRGRSSDRVVGQTARYLTWVVQRLGRGKQTSARGIIVGRDFDKHFAAAISQLKRVQPYTFDLKILCDPWHPPRDRAAR